MGPRARHSARVSWYRAASLSSYTIGTLLVAGEGEVASMLVVLFFVSEEDDGEDDEEEDGSGVVLVKAVVLVFVLIVPMLLRFTPSPTSSTRPRTRDTWGGGGLAMGKVEVSRVGWGVVGGRGVMG